MRQHTRPRNRRLRQLLAALALVLLTAGAVPANAAGDSRGRIPDAAAQWLIGKWDMLVTIHTDPVQYVSLICTFTPDQRLNCVNEQTSPPLHGRGVWQTSNGVRFSFWITHSQHEEGNRTGAINAVHLGWVTPTRFHTEAWTYIVYDDGGPWRGPIRVEADATRIE